MPTEQMQKKKTGTGNNYAIQDRLTALESNFTILSESLKESVDSILSRLETLEENSGSETDSTATPTLDEAIQFSGDLHGELYNLGEQNCRKLLTEIVGILHQDIDRDSDDRSTIYDVLQRDFTAVQKLEMIRLFSNMS